MSEPIELSGDERRKEILRAPWAYVWGNGVWHTFDEHGTGGQNSVSGSVVDAVIEATEAAVSQGFVDVTDQTLRHACALLDAIKERRLAAIDRAAP